MTDTEHGDTDTGYSRQRVRSAWERERFVAAMGVVASPVAVVATAGPGGRCGRTVTSVCSVSADPPTLLVCINRRSPACQTISMNRSSQ
jgi:flavin reductase (DIM6/NTAB) family NADH-FMN oxidoreductase RutF